jgi:hypothetical protein
MHATDWITAIATAMIAVFTVTIFIANWRQLRRTGEIERAYNGDNGDGGQGFQRF